MSFLMPGCLFSIEGTTLWKMGILEGAGQREWPGGESWSGGKNGRLCRFCIFIRINL